MKTLQTNMSHHQSLNLMMINLIYKIKLAQPNQFLSRRILKSTCLITWRLSFRGEENQYNNYLSKHLGILVEMSSRTINKWAIINIYKCHPTISKLKNRTY